MGGRLLLGRVGTERIGVGPCRNGEGKGDWKQMIPFSKAEVWNEGHLVMSALPITGPSWSCVFVTGSTAAVAVDFRESSAMVLTAAVAASAGEE